jgi:hypothetical protein
MMMRKCAKVRIVGGGVFYMSSRSRMFARSTAGSFDGGKADQQ